MGTVVTADLWVSFLNFYFDFIYSRNKQHVADDVSAVFVEHGRHGNNGLVSSSFPVWSADGDFTISWSEVETKSGTWWTYLHT